MHLGLPNLLRGALLTVALLAPAVAGAATFQQGLEAFEAGRYVQAADLWEAVAKGGDPYAQHALGKLYENGQGVPLDYARAAEWYARAAAQGLPAAENNLALLYAAGRGLPRDPARAVALWQKAAEAGHTHAQYNLGLAYYLGEGTARDDRQAAYWFTRAAQHGLAQAQFAIGQMNRSGVGIPKNEGFALAWYERAAAQGHAEAARLAGELRTAGVQPDTRQIEQMVSLSPLMDLPPQPPVPQATVPQQAVLVDGVLPPPLKPERRVDTNPQVASTARVSAPQPQQAPPQPTTAVAAPQPDGAGTAMIWLGSAENEGEARQLASQLVQRFPDVFGGLPPALVETNLGSASGYRVMVGPLAGSESAQELCRTLRAAEPHVFCKVVPRA